jgi:DNA polymerase-3 subunit gamma/tau
MNYQVLARKWRPHNFTEMVGQEHVLRALINALDQQRLHHAYLFTGTRGVGKTTVARILAKCFNCETGITSKPCGVCSTCMEIDAGCFADLIEVDAASRTKVEDTRELLDNVQYSPTRGRFKIYLIDEVHMLSGHSFNALLKTLEEPPEHVKFLLATTDPQKLPITVLSRCLQFHLKSLRPDLIEKQLAHILEQENIAFEKKALLPLTRAANGSMRDALSLLDQGIAFSNGKINYTDICAMLGTLEETHLRDLLTALADENAKQCLMVVHHLSEKNVDFQQVLDDLLACLHQIAITQAVPDLFEDELVAEFSKRFSKEDIQLYYQIALIGKKDFPYASDPKSGFEMIVLRMLAFQPKTFDKMATPTAVTAAPQTPIKQIPIKTVETHSKDRWSQLISQMSLSGLTHALALNCVLKAEADTHIDLSLAPQHAALYNEKQLDRINAALNQSLGKTIKLTIHIESPTPSTPAQQKQIAEQTRQTEIKTSLSNDSNVQDLIKTFGATIQQTTATDT